MTDPMDATTTAEEDRFTRFQRHLNLIWEVTQAAIAIGIVAATIAAAFFPSPGTTRLNELCLLIIGFYFGRSNHARMGGTESVVPSDRRKWRRKAT